jgi:hypothetical protein
LKSGIAIPPTLLFLLSIASVPSLSILWKSLRSIGFNFSSEVWYNSAENPSGPGLFFFGRLFIAASISLHVIDLFRWLISSWFS